MMAAEGSEVNARIQMPCDHGWQRVPPDWGKLSQFWCPKCNRVDISVSGSLALKESPPGVLAISQVEALP